MGIHNFTNTVIRAAITATHSLSASEDLPSTTPNDSGHHGLSTNQILLIAGGGFVFLGAVTWASCAWRNRCQQNARGGNPYGGGRY